MGAVAIVLFLDWFKGGFQNYHSLEPEERANLTES